MSRVKSTGLTPSAQKMLEDYHRKRVRRLSNELRRNTKDNQEVMSWTSVDDRLPDNYNPILAYGTHLSNWGEIEQRFLSVHMVVATGIG